MITSSKGRRRRAIGLAAASLAVAGLLAACSSGGDSSAAGASSSGDPVHGGNLVIDGYADIPTLNKDEVSVSNEAIRVAESIYGRLYVLSSQAKPVPSLATGYTLSSNKLTWTFHLRTDAKFSNGAPVTANDVKFSLELAKAGPYLGSLYQDISSILVPNAHTVVIKTSETIPTLLDTLTLYTSGIIPDNYDGESAAKFWAAPISSGAWEVSSYKLGVGCTVVPNKYYYGPKPYLDSVTYKPVPDANTRVLQLLNGQAQLIETPPYADLPSLRSGSTQVLEFPSTESDFLIFNTTKTPLNNVHLRQAISLAINRASIVTAALSGAGSPIGTWMSPDLMDGYEPAGADEYNLSAAKKQMAESSVPDGTKLTLLYNGSSSPAWSTAAEIVQQDLQAIGIDLSIQSADSNIVGAATENKTFDMTMGLLTYDVPDPGELVGYYFASNEYSSYLAAGNVKSLWETANTIFDGSKRLAVYKEVDNALAANADNPALYTVPWIYGASSDLHGMSVLSTGQFDFSKLWLS